MKHFLNQLFSTGWHNSSGLKLLSLSFLLFLFMGNTHLMGQSPYASNCTTSPITLVKPYIGYNGLGNEFAAMQAWCTNESSTTVQSYCDNLDIELKNQASNYDSLSGDCKAAYKARKHELGSIVKFQETGNMPIPLDY